MTAAHRARPSDYIANPTTWEKDETHAPYNNP